MKIQAVAFTRLHRCILRELALNFAACVTSLLALILISRGLQMRGLFLGLDFALSDIALILLFMIPTFLVLVLPISCMISVFLTFLRMSTDMELTAVKSGGIGIYNLLCAPLFFSCICMLVSMFVSVHAISWGMGNFRSTVLNIAGSRARVVVQPGVFNKDIFGLTLFARQVDPVDGRLRNVIFEDRRQEKNNSLTVLASEGNITTDIMHGDVVFNLRDGRIYRVDPDSGNISILEFGEYIVRLNLSALFSGADILGEVTPNEMSWNGLLNMRERGDAPNERFQRRVEVELHKRISLPAACLVLGIFAIPLACAFHGVRRHIGIILALFFFLVYYCVYSFGLTLSESGYLPPAAGLWLADGIFAPAALIGLHMAERERFPSPERLLGRLRNFRRSRAKGTAT
ncbi:MAG: LPS export ABC transporter permease LptF [Desulfovibrio sp.]|jgi:lipopolysaccharide export system permease protein|nr:LPS export ABC transporter permease LptF [Desulfovibrio sp.]